MATTRRLSERLTFGGRVPASVGVLLVVTLVASVASALSAHAHVPLGSLLALEPPRVLAGEVWRLLTWAFVEPTPLRLVFGLLLLYWLGKDLAETWGEGRFLRVWLGVTLFAAMTTCLLGFVDPHVQAAAHVGGLAIGEALVVAWGLTFPERVIRLYFVLPIRGAIVAWGTILLTVAFAVYSGWAEFVPTLAAFVAMLAYVHAPGLGRGARRPRPPAGASVVRKREVAAKRRASAAHLRLIEGGDHADAPLSPELEGTLDRLFNKKPPPQA